MNHGITGSVVELAALDWLRGLGYDVLSGIMIAPDELDSEWMRYFAPVFAPRDVIGQSKPAGTYL